MLCDSTGGEGRNFQCADYIVHIDLPWDASAIEQRIGRLDRLERDMFETGCILCCCSYQGYFLKKRYLVFSRMV